MEHRIAALGGIHEVVAARSRDRSANDQSLIEC
jgi:hypothetical protein